MGAILNLPQTFEQRIAAFSVQVEAETEGEYSLLACNDGYVELMYKGTGLIKILAQGRKYKEVYDSILLIIRAFVLHQLADLEELLKKEV